jgi:hypothetical protein
VTRRDRIWLFVDVVFAGANLAGAGFALAGGEGIHAGVHAALALIGMYLGWRIVSRWEDALEARQPAMRLPPEMSDLSSHLRRLEQTMEAMAIEIERIGEGQRYVARILSAGGVEAPARHGAGEPSAVEARKGDSDLH